MIKQQQQKHHHRTEAKNRIQQHCFSSGLPPCLKGKYCSVQYLQHLWIQDHKQLINSQQFTCSLSQGIIFLGRKNKSEKQLQLQKYRGVMNWKAGSLADADSPATSHAHVLARAADALREPCPDTHRPFRGQGRTFSLQESLARCSFPFSCTLQCFRLI